MIVLADSEAPDDLPDGAGEASDPLPAVLPPVAVVVVTHNPGPWFAETLEALAAQTYENLAFLFVDNGSEVDPTEQIQGVLPDAEVELLGENLGFGPAVNRVSDRIEGAAFFVLSHDDVAPDPTAVRSLVEEAFRSNAGIIGPKLVEWDRPDRLLQAGMGADKTGVLVPVTERGELDQEQHDAVRDVFCAPGAFTLIRADLFGALDGFDDGILGLGDDLDLCWRAHVVGARVMLGPAARVRHLEALGARQPTDDRRRQFARHRLRTSLVGYGTWHRIRVIPQAFVFALIEAVYGVISGRPERSRDVLAAWPWNLRRMGEIRKRRAALAEHRRVSDRELRDLQVSGSARVRLYIRSVFGRDTEGVGTFARSSRDVVGSLREGSRQLTGTFAMVLAMVLVVSSRGLIFKPIPAVGEFAAMPGSPNDFLSAWWSGWLRPGLGGPGAQPTGLGLLGLGGYVALGAMDLLRTILILGCVPVGAIGAWRLARPLASSRASVAAFAVYLAVPVPYNALSRGSWAGLVAYAVSPWLILGLARASGLAPFSPTAETPSDDVAAPQKRGVLSLTLGLGLLLGVSGAFVPALLVLVPALAACFVVGSLLCFRVAGTARMVVVALGATVTAFVLNLPWSFELISTESPWEAVVGISPTTGGPMSLGRVMRFETGPWGAPPMGWAFLGAAALPLIIGRSWRLDWAVRSWVVITAGWTVLWLSQDGQLPVGLPPAEVVLAPVAAALAFTAALGLASFEIDLRAFAFGWRQVVAVVAAVGVLIGAAPLAAGLIDGRWRMPERGYLPSVDELTATGGEPAFRTLWLGDPVLLPAAAWRLDESLAYSATDRGVPSMLDRLPGPPPGETSLLADAVETALDRRTTRLGHMLAPMGVRYLVVPSRLAPSVTSVTGQLPPPEELLRALALQTDLEEVPVGDGLSVYRNSAWISARSVLPAEVLERTSPDQAVSDQWEGAPPALEADSGAVGASGAVPEEGVLLAASTADPNWNLKINGVPAARHDLYGWANGFDAARSGTGELSYHTPSRRRLAIVGQVVLWVGVVVVRGRARRRERARSNDRAGVAVTVTESGAP